jgi:hypothetical protein
LTEYCPGYSWPPVFPYKFNGRFFNLFNECHDRIYNGSYGGAAGKRNGELCLVGLACRIKTSGDMLST